MSNRKTMGNLANSVGLSFSLAIVTITVSNTSYNTNIVRVASSIGIVYREPKSNLSNGVGITVSLPLAIEGPVTNSSKASHVSIAIVNTCNNPTIGSTIGYLANSVGVTVTVNTGKG